MGDSVEILEKEEVRFSVPGVKDKLRVNSFVSRKGDRESLVFYWYKSGDEFTNKYLAQQARVVLNQLAGKNAVAALIRISTGIRDKDKERASQTLQKFSRDAIPEIVKYTP